MDENPRYWLIVGYSPDGIGLDEEVHQCYGPCLKEEALDLFRAHMQNGTSWCPITITHHFSSESPIT
jgi:hypothetical protein